MTHFRSGLCCLIGLACGLQSLSAAQIDSIQLIPRPASVTYQSGTLRLPTSLRLAPSTPDYVRHTLTSGGYKVSSSRERSATLRVSIDSTLQGIEAYRLDITPRGIQLKGKNEEALRQGTQSLLQLLTQYGRTLPSLAVADSARLPYRGVMLDVSRHFMSADMIIRLLDEMARYKLNRFHWHLVDGGGWRFPSEKYPLLTKKAAFRTESDWDKWWQKDRRFVDEGTPGAYGGYYTKADIQRVVKHAADLGITIIPEIEMPGHSNEVFAAYPELTCAGKWTFDSSDVCIGNEKTFQFFEDILDEVMALFPSKYIHIGGDEAEMKHWKECPKCQARIKAEGLKDEHGLQSYMIHRIEKYLNSKGRRLIGWDEILMGGLAPDATVMSWRGEKGGIEAAQSGHDVILTPGSHLYLDFYQREADGEPRANGGYNTLEKVYSYNPMPKELTPEQAHHIIGVQANLWTEYVADEKHAEYMLFPRIVALSEIAWTPQAERSYPNFLKRMNYHLPRLQQRGINAYPLKRIEATTEVDTLAHQVAVRLSAERTDAEIRYTTDGTEPTAQSQLYAGKPIISSDSILLVARLYKDSKPLDLPELRYRADYHKGIGKKITYNGKRWNDMYPANGDKTLLDGYRGTPTYGDGLWQGITGDMDVTIDLGREEELHHVLAKFMQERIQGVIMPVYVEVSVSTDGKNFTPVGKQSTKVAESDLVKQFETFSFPMHTRARYVRFFAKRHEVGGFLFSDEIVIH